MNRERKKGMWGWALKFARSGEHSGWRSIEKELQALGYAAAKRWLSEEDRERLDQLCAEARKGRDDA